MSSDKLLSIGAFAFVSGLSISALRHYDEVGLLKPAFVDPATGYRRYGSEQAGRARLIGALRGIDLPIDAIREVVDQETALRHVLARHQERLLERAHALSQMACRAGQYIEHGVPMSVVSGPRIVQVTIHVRNRQEAIDFYAKAFDATFNAEISSFQFGAWPGDDFFLVTIAAPEADGGPSRFGLLVGDVDAAHQRALAAGATELHPPTDTAWKPRSSCVIDPSANRIDLYQG
ncbi:MerR family transcriptional regulator [Nonomuraea sp. K274]|uniref:MerR family transcriptional regulator n=1 Tax=Nonomuraea cypriaca TaxID=1187855 RepID=A0A931AD17_9ACTN|nr:MerR family transcriptional regulator [Nonomuraea cypriaca]MBF8189658.1 MerR family transcriptional regulator [Nonomuraea cypriaca]